MSSPLIIDGPLLSSGFGGLELSQLEFVIASLVSEGSGQACESVGKAVLLSDHFDSQQCREFVDLPRSS